MMINNTNDKTLHSHYGDLAMIPPTIISKSIVIDPITNHDK